MNDKLQSVYCTTTYPETCLDIMIHGTDNAHIFVYDYTLKAVPLIVIST
jgi:hypothetical protein